MPSDALRIEIEFLRRELQKLQQPGREWHSSKGIFVYVGCATGFLVICSLFGADVELGRTGQAITAMVALACFCMLGSETNTIKERLNGRDSSAKKSSGTQSSWRNARATALLSIRTTASGL
jgi:hypothetical protein